MVALQRAWASLCIAFLNVVTTERIGQEHLSSCILTLREAFRFCTKQQRIHADHRLCKRTESNPMKARSRVSGNLNSWVRRYHVPSLQIDCTVRPYRDVSACRPWMGARSRELRGAAVSTLVFCSAGLEREDGKSMQKALK